MTTPAASTTGQPVTSCSTCGGLGGVHSCHRCRTAVGVRPRFVVDNATPCLAGVQPKVTGYQTWGCDACWDAFQAESGSDG